MKFKYISWLPACILMGIIFYFSSKPVDSSNDSSITIANGILTAYETITNQPIQLEVRANSLGLINHIVRKTAHFSEYALLAIAFAFHLAVCKKKGRTLLFLPILCSAIYAASDEFHQTFVEGRGGQAIDVLLDTTGAIAGSLFFCLLCYLHDRKRRISEDKVLK